jgi:prepilin-type N-terminal cleavage/methylation domain-containing protein
MMTTSQNRDRQAEQGFTLVELAIVMVIIGLLIGGILKGQELIATAQVGSTVAQVKTLDAAMNTFIEKYNAYPGDIANATNRLPNCAAAPCSTDGTGGTTGNSRIEGGAVTTAPTAGQEAGLMFVHLNAADLVSGINPQGGATFGGQFPTARVGGGMWAAYSAAAIAGTSLPGGKHYATLSGSPTGAVGNTTGAFDATTGAQIDRKIDDGAPQTGTAQTIGTGCFTGVGATAIYAENNDGGTCTTYIRVLN